MFRHKKLGDIAPEARLNAFACESDALAPACAGRLEPAEEG